jgi:hypothetical protein
MKAKGDGRTNGKREQGDDGSKKDQNTECAGMKASSGNPLFFKMSKLKRI